MVIVTEPGELRKFGVKKLLHVAAFVGTPGSGYQPVRNVDQCITHALEKLHELNSEAKETWLFARVFSRKTSLMASVLFPVFGASSEGQRPKDALMKLVTAACKYVQEHEESSINRIYFQAYSKEERRLWKQVMEIHEELEEVSLDAVSEDMQPTWETMTAEDLASRLRKLKEAAQSLREQKKLDGAIELLKHGMVEGLEALKSGNRNVVLAQELADCFGMLGGNLNRQGNINEMLAVYKKGRDIEMDTPGLTLTYNTVNLLVARLLDSGWAALHDSAPDMSDIARVVARLEAKVKGAGRDDQWAWADLGMCEFLRDKFDAAEEAYRKAASVAEEKQRRSMLEQLMRISERWPQEQGRRPAFYETVSHVLSYPGWRLGPAAMADTSPVPWMTCTHSPFRASGIPFLRATAPAARRDCTCRADPSSPCACPRCVSAGQYVSFPTVRLPFPRDVQTRCGSVPGCTVPLATDAERA